MPEEFENILWEPLWVETEDKKGTKDQLKANLKTLDFLKSLEMRSANFRTN